MLDPFWLIPQPSFDLKEFFILSWCLCRARNREVDAAAEMYKSTMQWRSSYSISEVMDDFGSAGHFGKDGGRITDPAEWTWLPHANTREAELAYRHAFFTRLPAKHSGELQPVLIWRAGHADYKGIVREELVDIMIKAFVVHLEVPCFLD